MDPQQVAKQSTRQWLGQCFSSLNDNVESWEADLEKLIAKGEW